MMGRQTTAWTRWRRWTAALVLCVATLGPALAPGLLPELASALLPQAQAQGASVVPGVEEARARFGRISQSLEGLREQRAQQETQYSRLTGQIADRKRGRSQEALSRDLALQGLLKDARQRADDLNGLQKKIRQRERELEKARGEILAAYDVRLSQLEDIVLDNSLAPARADAIAELNRLRRERHAYVTPRPASPDLALESLPALTQDFTDPEEARAAAAELSDADRKLQGHIEQLEGQIQELEAERRLRRRALDFRERQAFFDDERTGGRNVARTGTGDRSAPATNGGDVASGGATNGGTRDQGEAAQEPSSDLDQGGNNANAAPPEADSDGALGEEADDGAFDGGGEAADPNVGGHDNFENQGDQGGGLVGTPTALPQDLGGPADPFGGGDVIIQNDAETLGQVPGVTEDDSESLEERLKRIKRQRDALERRSVEIQRRARDLQELADEL